MLAAHQCDPGHQPRPHLTARYRDPARRPRGTCRTREQRPPNSWCSVRVWLTSGRSNTWWRQIGSGLDRDRAAARAGRGGKVAPPLVHLALGNHGPLVTRVSRLGALAPRGARADRAVGPLCRGIARGRLRGVSRTLAGPIKQLLHPAREAPHSVRAASRRPPRGCPAERWLPRGYVVGRGAREATRLKRGLAGRIRVRRLR